jgi:hypothetical protein
MMSPNSPVMRFVSLDYYAGSLEGLVETKSGRIYYYKLAYLQWGVAWKGSVFELRFFYFWPCEKSTWDCVRGFLSKYETPELDVWYFMTQVDEGDWLRATVECGLPRTLPQYIYCATQIEEEPVLVARINESDFLSFDKSAKMRSARAIRLFRKIESLRIDPSSL